MMYFEPTSKKTRTTDEVQDAMKKEVVFHIEMTIAKTRLMKLKESGAMKQLFPRLENFGNCVKRLR